VARRLAGAELAERRVALFLNALAGGGAERNLLALGRGLCARGYTVEFVLAERRGPLLAELPPDLACIELGVGGWFASARALARLPTWPEKRGWDPREGRGTATRLAPLRWGRRNALSRSLLPLVDYLRGTRPSVLVTTLPKNALVALWARHLARVPCRVVVREANTFSREAAKGTPRKAALLTDLARQWYPRADAVVAVSRGVEADVIAALNLTRERVSTIYNAVNPEEIAARATQPVDDPWFAADAPPVLISVGRLSLQKDHATLLRAFAQLRRERNARLLLVGEGSQRPRLEELARELGIESELRMPGFVANPHALVSRAAAFVLSSAWEGFPNVLVEALACGCPTISTDCPHGPAEILAGGEYGALCPPGDAEALARVLAKTLDAPPRRERLQRRARDFAPERTLRAYLEVMFPSPSSFGPR